MQERSSKKNETILNTLTLLAVFSTSSLVKVHVYYFASIFVEKISFFLFVALNLLHNLYRFISFLSVLCVKMFMSLSFVNSASSSCS